MTIRFHTKAFDELSVRELHDLLRLRTDVFVVEQTCAYAEIDGRDPSALHILGLDASGAIIAYARILPPEIDGLPHVGRVVVRADHRHLGIATALMEHALEQMNARYGSRRSELAAQAHLDEFYERFGYVRIGPEYPWDGIPHIDMRRDEP